MVDTQQATSSILPSIERIQQELGRAKSIDDFFGKDGIFARLFADTLEQMLDAELTAHLGYPHPAPEGRNSGNSPNGKRTRQLRMSSGDTSIQVPRDRTSTFQSPLLERTSIALQCDLGRWSSRLSTIFEGEPNYLTDSDSTT